MYKFKPVYEAGTAAEYMRGFVKDHESAFWNILKPLLPFIIGAELLDVVLSSVLSSEEKEIESFIGSLIGAYFMTVLVISWHRLVIHGLDEFVPMNPLKPQKNEIKFMAVGIAMSIVGIVTVVLVPLLFGVIHKTLAIIAILLFVPFLIFVLWRLCFYFPAMATNEPITLKQAFGMTKGYLLKLAVSGFLASWRVILAALGYTIIIGIAISVTGESILAMRIVFFIAVIPLLVYVQAILTVIGVTVLSNYYQHALQNGPVYNG